MTGYGVGMDGRPVSCRAGAVEGRTSARTLGRLVVLLFLFLRLDQDPSVKHLKTEFGDVAAEPLEAFAESGLWQWRIRMIHVRLPSLDWKNGGGWREKYGPVCGIRIRRPSHGLKMPDLLQNGLVWGVIVVRQAEG